MDQSPFTAGEQLRRQAVACERTRCELFQNASPRARSAGVGRTGVFITLSIVLERMRYEGAVDIFQTVKMLRTQRPAMVQTEVNDERQINEQLMSFKAT